MTGLLRAVYTPAQMTRLTELFHRLEHINRYGPTLEDIKVAILYTKLRNRLPRPTPSPGYS